MGTVFRELGLPLTLLLPRGSQLPVMDQELAHSQRRKCPQNWEMLIPGDFKLPGCVGGHMDTGKATEASNFLLFGP